MYSMSVALKSTWICWHVPRVLCIGLQSFTCTWIISCQGGGSQQRHDEMPRNRLHFEVFVLKLLEYTLYCGCFMRGREGIVSLLDYIPPGKILEEWKAFFPQQLQLWCHVFQRSSLIFTTELLLSWRTKNLYHFNILHCEQGLHYQSVDFVRFGVVCST